jgi:hypothetical protein
MHVDDAHTLAIDADLAAGAGGLCEAALHAAASTKKACRTLREKLPARAHITSLNDLFSSDFMLLPH